MPFWENKAIGNSSIELKSSFIRNFFGSKFSFIFSIL